MKSALDVDVSTRFKQQLLNSGGEGHGSAQTREAELRKQYLTLLKDKLDKWCQNLVAMEVEPWYEIPDAETQPFMPDQDRNGLYYTDTPKNLFSMVDSQVEVAFEDGNGEVFADGLILQCIAALNSVHAQLTLNVNRVHDMYYAEGMEEEERPPMMVEYFMVCSNNCATSINYIEQLREKLATRYNVETDTAMKIYSRHLAQVTLGWQELGTLSASMIIKIIMADMHPYFVQLFVEKWMRSSVAAGTIVATAKDYIGDVQTGMHQDYLHPMMRECYLRVVVHYVEEFVAPKKFKCKSGNDVTDMMERFGTEIDNLGTVFAPFFQGAKVPVQDP
jgi:hypothetical protein